MGSPAPGRGSLGLTQRGWIMVGVAVGCVVAAYVTNVDGLLFVGAFLAAVIGCGLVSAVHRRPRVVVQRAFSSDRVTARRPVRVTLDVANRAFRPVVAGEWSDDVTWLPQKGSGARAVTESSADELLPAIAAASDRGASVGRVSYELVPPRRGEFELGPMRIRVTDPFAVAWCVVAAGGTRLGLAGPAVTELPQTGISFAEADGSARRVSHRALGGEHDLTTRDYRSGDPLRRVHWRASAHHGELMVRQEEQRSNAEASVLLDTRWESYPDATTQHRGVDVESELFEWAVEFVASLVKHLGSAGLLVRLVETGRQQLSDDALGDEIIDGLARVALVDAAQSEVPSLRGSGRASESLGGTIVAVVADVDDDVLQALVAGRSGFARAIVFVLGDAGAAPERVTTALRRAGWLCVAVAKGARAEDAWQAAADSAGWRRG